MPADARKLKRGTPPEERPDSSKRLLKRVWWRSPSPSGQVVHQPTLGATDVFPYQPMWVQEAGAVTGVKTPCTPVPGLDVNTHSDGTPGFKPPKKLLEQPGRHTGSTVGRDYIQVLDFTVAAVALSEMAADVAHHPLLSLCEVEDAGLQGLLRMVFPSKVPGHPGVCPARLGVSVASLLQVRNISHSGLTKMNCLGLGQRKDTSTIVAHRSGICTRARANGQRLSCALTSSVVCTLSPSRQLQARVRSRTLLATSTPMAYSIRC